MAGDDLLGRVLDALDWRALGDVYFHEGGEAELRNRRDAVVALGGELARGLLRRLPRSGRSLWVGAGLAELPVLLAETAIGRGVVATNLRASECELLNAALRRAGAPVGLQLLAVDARTESRQAGAFDHIGCISLFTDPETWPLLSDVTYGRIAPVQLDVERFAAEREAARELAQLLFSALQRPGWVTTSAEEAAWFLEPAVAAEVAYDADEELIETAIVGDPVGFLRFG